MSKKRFKVSAEVIETIIYDYKDFEILAKNEDEALKLAKSRIDSLKNDNFTRIVACDHKIYVTEIK